MNYSQLNPVNKHRFETILHKNTHYIVDNQLETAIKDICKDKLNITNMQLMDLLQQNSIKQYRDMELVSYCNDNGNLYKAQAYLYILINNCRYKCTILYNNDFPYITEVANECQ